MTTTFARPVNPMSSVVYACETGIKNRAVLTEQINTSLDNLVDRQRQLVLLEQAQQLLSTVSEDNTTAVLDYVTEIINKALAEVFKSDVRRITLTKTLWAGRHVHINVELVNSEGRKRDLMVQSGTGLRQIVAFLYQLCLIEVRKGRRIFIMDEILSGVHKTAKVVMLDIMRIFAQGGWQFVMVEYGVDDFGKMYHVEKPGTEAKVYALGDRKYTGEIYMFQDGMTDEVSVDL